MMSQETRGEDWLDTLADEARRSSQARVAAKIGYSPGVVNQVLGGTYKGDLTAVQKAVEGAFMDGTVECPVMGTLAGNKCLTIQRRKFAGTNPQRVQLWRACRSGCPSSRIGGDNNE